MTETPQERAADVLRLRRAMRAIASALGAGESRAVAASRQRRRVEGAALRLRSQVGEYQVHTTSIPFAEDGEDQYETMIFRQGEPLAGYQCRYLTREGAHRGHNEAIEWVQSSVATASHNTGLEITPIVFDDQIITTPLMGDARIDDDGNTNAPTPERVEDEEPTLKRRIRVSKRTKP